MKKLFAAITVAFFSFSLCAQHIERITVFGKTKATGIIEYYDDGLIKNAQCGDFSFECAVTQRTESQLVASVHWKIYGSDYQSNLNITVSSALIHFNEDFLLPKRKIPEKDIAICGDEFSNPDFYLNISPHCFSYKTGSQDWILKNGTVYDRNSFGKIESDVFVRPLSRFTKNNDGVSIGRYYCYEYNAGGFTYVQDETIAFIPAIDRNEISSIHKFLNFYLLSASTDVSFLPFLVLYAPTENYKKENTIVSYSATSHLIEKNAAYVPENLGTLPGLPWASANGYGIGDSIIIRADIFKDFYISVFNGFQSDKKYLYEQNSRIKKAEITNLDTNEKSVVEFADTPQKQRILICANNGGENFVGRFRLKILEVYPGTKYKDLCIQAILAD